MAVSIGSSNSKVNVDKVSKVKYRKVLNTGQLDLLICLVKYRFSSVELLKQVLGLSVASSGLYQKLEILVQQGYVGKRYEASYRLRGRAAAYYVTAKGFKALGARPGKKPMDERFAKYSYKDKNATEAFIDRCLLICRLDIRLRELYPKPGVIDVFTKRELAGYEMFPEQPPDAYIQLKVPGDGKHHYMLEYIPQTLFLYMVEKRFDDYREFFDDNGWDVSGEPMPAVLFLCDNKRDEKRVRRVIVKKLTQFDNYGAKYYTSNLEALNEATSRSKTIWTSVEDSDDVYSLAAIAVNE